MTATDITASDVRDAHAVQRWDREVDVVVVGFGCAGAAVFYAFVREPRRVADVSLS